MSGIHGPVGYSRTCEFCGKRTYASRALARRVARTIPGVRMRPYRCPGDETAWHAGHLPEVVRRGLKTANEVYRRSA